MEDNSMKRYISPDFELIRFSAYEDILTDSSEKTYDDVDIDSDEMFE